MPTPWSLCIASLVCGADVFFSDITTDEFPETFEVFVDRLNEWIGSIGLPEILF